MTDVDADLWHGSGQPLPRYDKREEDWPAAWRLPDLAEEEADLFGKFAHLTDDVTLRTAVNVWDNGLRLPGSAEGIAGGMLSAHARVGLISLGGQLHRWDLERAANAIRDGWLGMARQVVEHATLAGTDPEGEA